MYQESLLEREQESNIPRSYQGDFHANPTALQENIWRLMINAIYGENCSECFAKLTPDGLWEKMYQGCSQVRMEGFSEEYLKIWPKSGVVYGGTAFQPILVELNTTGKGGISMAEYIDREAALNILCRENCGHDYEAGKCNNCYTSSFIEYIPAADVAPVKRGKRIEDGYDGKENVCSQCGSEFPLKSESGKIPKKQVNFCYYCGAKMDLEGQA